MLMVTRTAVLQFFAENEAKRREGHAPLCELLDNCTVEDVATAQTNDFWLALSKQQPQQDR